MQLILVNKRGAPRRLDLRRPLHALLILLALTPPLFLAAFAGHGYAVYGGAADTDAHVARWRAQIAQQQKDVDSAKRKTSQEVAALGQQVAGLHAELIRLDALGARLVQMAGLNRGEFDFSQPPALGGPLDGPGSSPLDNLGTQATLDALASLLSDRQRQLDVLEHFLLTRKLENRVEPRGEPVDTAYISSYFGRRSDPFTGHLAHHQGVDFAGAAGSPIKTVADGVVSWSGKRNGYGNLVEVNHGNGLTTRYGHNSKNLVTVGDRVERGQVIALMGSTGRSTGSHLHFEVLQDGRSRNPMAYIRDTE
jgi:murein DD-endopeptidase MepM/ murein hydrolase activator NlpD